MVRLKVKEGKIKKLDAYVFQFQYGAIKSHPDETLGMKLTYFNSSMVRLKGNRIATFGNICKISIPVWCD